MYGATVRVNTDIHFRKLRSVTFAAQASNQAQDHLALSPQCSHGGLGGSLSPDAHFRVNQVPEFQPFWVIVYGFFICKITLETVSLR